MRRVISIVLVEGWRSQVSELARVVKEEFGDE
jgi:hypothetical protein